NAGMREGTLDGEDPAGPAQATQGQEHDDRLQDSKGRHMIAESPLPAVPRTRRRTDGRCLTVERALCRLRGAEHDCCRAGPEPSRTRARGGGGPPEEATSESRSVVAALDLLAARCDHIPATPELVQPLAPRIPGLHVLEEPIERMSGVGDLQAAVTASRRTE